MLKSVVMVEARPSSRSAKPATTPGAIQRPRAIEQRGVQIALRQRALLELA